MQGTVRPHTLQDAIVRGMHDAQTGPSAKRVLTRRRCPQRTHSSRLTGSLTRQFGHSGLPPESRVAGSRAAPQRLQGTALALATQLRQLHCPVQAAVQADDAAAVRAGWPGDLPGSSGAQLVDQPQHRRGGRLGAIAGEQRRPGLNGPGQAPQLALPGEHPPGGIGDRAGGQRRIQPGDDPGENGQRVALVTVRAPVTARLAVPGHGWRPAAAGRTMRTSAAPAAGRTRSSTSPDRGAASR